MNVRAGKNLRFPLTHTAMKFFCLALLLICHAGAATTIEVVAKLADIPAGMEVPASAAKLDQIKGVDVLTAPRVITSPGRSAAIEVTQQEMVPGADTVALGVAIHVTPTIGEKTIHFTGKATDRASHGKRSNGGVNTVEFATREIYFEGNTTSGGTVIIHTAPVTSKAAKEDKVVTKSRELVIYLTFTKRTTGDAPAKKPAAKSPSKPAAKAKPAPSGKKKR